MIEFINSEICKIDGVEEVYFRDHHSLIKDIFKTLSTIGAKKFLSSPEENIKKKRESMAECFFISALKKDTNQDWWLLQLKDDPPDFVLMTVKDGPPIIELTLDEFELVEIPGFCKSSNEMMDIVQSKLTKGYSESYHLLIFINNEKSKEWVNLLYGQIKVFHPFKSVWTVHLLQNKESKFISVVNRLRPYPVRHIESAFNDSKLNDVPPIPNFMEETIKEEGTFLAFKKDFTQELTRGMRRILLNRSKLKSK
jgi:uncharacterized protein YeaO (DUF488 family)